MTQHSTRIPLSRISSVVLISIATMVVVSLAVPFTQNSRAATTWDVSIVNFDFQLDSIEIMPGDTVRWTNNADRNHDVTEAGNAWTSGIIPPGGTYSRTFDTIGDVNYYCSIHPGMTGVVRVGTEIPEFSSSFYVVLGMIGLLVGMIFVRKKR